MLRRLPKFPAAFAQRVTKQSLTMIFAYVPIEAKMLCGDAITTSAQSMLNAAAAVGWVAAFKRLTGNTSEASEYAIRNDHVNILEHCYLFKKQLSCAAKYGAMRCFRYLRENLVGSLDHAAKTAARYNQCDVMQYIIDYTPYTPQPILITIALYNDNYDMTILIHRYLLPDEIITTNLQLLETYVNDIDADVIVDVAIRRNRMDVIHWLNQSFVFPMNNVLITAAKCNNVPALEFAIANGADDPEAIYEAIACSSVQSFNILYRINRIPLNDLLVRAVESRQLRMMHYLRYLGADDFNTAFLSAALNDNIKFMCVLRRWGANNFMFILRNFYVTIRVQLLCAAAQTRLGSSALGAEN